MTSKVDESGSTLQSFSAGPQYGKMSIAKPVVWHSVVCKTFCIAFRSLTLPKRILNLLHHVESFQFAAEDLSKFCEKQLTDYYQIS